MSKEFLTAVSIMTIIILSIVGFMFILIRTIDGVYFNQIKGSPVAITEPGVYAISQGEKPWLQLVEPINMDIEKSSE